MGHPQDFLSEDQHTQRRITEKQALNFGKTRFLKLIHLWTWKQSSYPRIVSIEASLFGDEAEDLSGAPIGPVAGGIMACFLVLALGVYCYRHYSHMFGSHGEGTSWDSSQARLGPPAYVEDQDESDCPDSDEQEPPHPSSSRHFILSICVSFFHMNHFECVILTFYRWRRISGHDDSVTISNEPRISKT